MSQPNSPAAPSAAAAPSSTAAPSSAAAPSGKRILSGIKSSGTLHIGNYLGAVRAFIALHLENDARYFIADYHSMTTVRSAQQRRDYARAIALDYIALGLDPKRAMLYRQSDVPEVHELAWVLATVTPLGLLERAHAYKDARASNRPVDMGLLNYPILMAADILLHRAELVPVGQDQKQHIEMARDMAQHFNFHYGEVLALPEPYILESVAVVPGTDGRKMSKSYGNTIEMFAPAAVLKKQIMGIVTDSTPVEAPKDPALPVFQLWSLFASEPERSELVERCRRGGLGYGEVKKGLLERVMGHFEAARERRAAWAQRESELEDVLRDGARRVREATAPLLAAAREAAGIGPLR
jgi:tryptophanyl-tRNA synthetase